MRKYVISVSILILLVIGGAIVTDFIDITKYLPFTKNYDWLNVVSAVIGGLIGGLFTFLGISLSIKNERKNNQERLIEDKKQNGYSYLVFDNNPIKITIALDSLINVQEIKNDTNLVIAENVKADCTQYIEFELSFKNINTNFPSAVGVNKITLLYNSCEKDNKIIFNDIMEFTGYSISFKPITLKNDNTIAFKCTALINSDQLNNIKTNLINSERIDVKADISFLNPNNIITRGIFSSNLQRNNHKKIGNKNNLGSNKICNEYSSINNYFIIDKIDYIENNSIKD